MILEVVATEANVLRSVAPQPVRVLHVFGRMERGGAELRTLDIMRQLDQAEFVLEFCTLTGLSGTLDDEIRSNGGEVHPCPLGPRFAMRFKRLLLNRRIDIVHSHVQLFSGYILRLAAQVGIKVRIAHFRSTSDAVSRSPRRRVQGAVMRRWLDRYATHILGVNASVLRLGWSSAFMEDPRCAVIYNGLDVAAFRQASTRDEVLAELGFSTDSEIIVHVGNMSIDKNHLRLVDIFAALAARRPTARLVLVGRRAAAIEDAVVNRMAEGNLGESIRILGQRSDVPRLLLAANLMIFPSRLEGLPGAVLEARAAGVAVVAADLPGIIEIADFLPGVVTLSLDEPDEAWVTASEAALSASSSQSDKTGAAERFARSPFALDACVTAMTDIWRSV